MAFQLQVARKFVEEVIAQALAEQPLECCGLLAGVRDGAVGRVVRRYPLVNAAASPREFLSDARSLFDADKDMRTRGLEILAVYHSHPTSPPIPSHTDRERNWMGDEVVCMIVSLAASPPEVRAWRLTATEHHEAAWEVIDEAVQERRG